MSNPRISRFESPRGRKLLGSGHGLLSRGSGVRFPPGAPAYRAGSPGGESTTGSVSADGHPFPGGSLGAFIVGEYLPGTTWGTAYRVEGTRLAYHLAEVLGHHPLAGLTRREVKVWWAGLVTRVHGQEWRPETANKHLRLLRAIYNVALDQEAVTANPTAGIKQLRIDPSTLPTEHFEGDERDRVLAIAKDQGRDCYISVALAVFTGARRSSVFKLRVGDVDLIRGHLSFPTKSGAVKTFPIHEGLRDALWEACAGRWPEHRVISWSHPDSIGKAWEKVRKQAGLGRSFRYHGLRHDFGTRLLKATGNLRLVQVALGHSKITQTERYTHLVNEDVDRAILGL